MCILQNSAYLHYMCMRVMVCEKPLDLSVAIYDEKFISTGFSSLYNNMKQYIPT